MAQYENQTTNEPQDISRNQLMNSKLITISKKSRRKITQMFGGNQSLTKINNQNGLNWQFSAFEGKCQIYVANEERRKTPKVLFVWLDDKYEKFMEDLISDCVNIKGQRENGQ